MIENPMGTDGFEPGEPMDREKLPRVWPRARGTDVHNGISRS